jgi:hypothetical protein
MVAKGVLPLTSYAVEKEQSAFSNQHSAISIQYLL